MSISKRLLSGVSFNLITQIGQALFGFIITYTVAHLFGASILGRYSLSLSISNLIATIGKGGLHNAITKFVSPLADKRRWTEVGNKIILIYIISFISTSILCLFCYIGQDIIINIFIKQDIKKPLQLILIATPFVSNNMIIYFAFRAIRQFKYEALYNGVVRGATILVFIIIFKIFGIVYDGITIVVLSVLIAEVLIAILSFYSLDMRCQLFRAFLIYKNLKWKNVKPILLFSFPLMMTAIVQYGMNNFQNLIIGFYLNSSELGIYRVAFQFTLIGTFILKAFGSVMAPLISEEYEKKDMISLEKNYKLSTYWIIVGSIPIFVALIVLPKEIIVAIFGNEYSNGGLIVLIITLGQVLNSFTGQCGFIIMLTGKEKLFFMTSCGALILNLGLSFALIPKYGLIGAAISMGFGIMGVNIIRVLIVYYLYRFTPFDNRILKPILSALVTTIIIFIFKVQIDLINIYQLISALVMIIVIYLTTLSIFGVNVVKTFLFYAKKY